MNLASMSFAASTGSFALALGFSFFAPTQAQTVSSTPQVPPTALTITTPHAPVARQIEPMVAPVRRVSPNAAIAPKAASSATASAPAASVPVPSAATAAAMTSPTAAAGAAPPPPSAVATTATKAAPPPHKNGQTTNAARATLPAPAGVKPHKLVAYTCKIGQDYSVERKICFTPGVKSAAAPVRRAKLAPSKTTLDPTARSALGVKLR